MAMTAFGVDVDALVAAQDLAARDAWRERERVTRDWQRAGWGQGMAFDSTRTRRAGVFADAQDPPVTVDVYLSAGFHAPSPDSAEYRSCNNTQAGNCSLWRVRMVLGSRHALEVEEIAAADVSDACPRGVGHIQPAVSPSGERLAWVSTCGGGAGWSELTYQDLTDGTGGVAVTAIGGEAGPTFPAWRDDDTLNYSTSNQDADDTRTMWQAEAFPDFKTVQEMDAVAGWGGKPGLASHDVEWHPNPLYTNASGGPELVSFGGSTADELVPRVTSNSGNDEASFSLPPEWSGDAVLRPPQCHHPSWNPDGTTILCTRYKDPETIEGELPTGDLAEYDASRIYGFTNTGSGWNVDAALIELLSPDEINELSTNSALPNGLFPPRTSAGGHADGCGGYVWKFAQWCGTDRWILATLACTDNTSTASPKTILNSRVFLIDVSDGATSPDDYVDLVRFVERKARYPFGSFNGIFATSHVVA